MAWFPGPGTRPCYTLRHAAPGGRAAPALGDSSARAWLARVTQSLHTGPSLNLEIGALRLWWHLRLLWEEAQLQWRPSWAGFGLLVGVTTLTGQVLHPQLAAKGETLTATGILTQPTAPDSMGVRLSPCWSSLPLCATPSQPGQGLLPGSQEGTAVGPGQGPSPRREVLFIGLF